MSLGTKWILPDVGSADTGGHSGIHLEWVKETSMYRILCDCKMAYIGETDFCIKTNTTDLSILNKSAVVEHNGVNFNASQTVQYLPQLAAFCNVRCM